MIACGLVVAPTTNVFSSLADVSKVDVATKDKAKPAEATTFTI